MHPFLPPCPATQPVLAQHLCLSSRTHSRTAPEQPPPPPCLQSLTDEVTTRCLGPSTPPALRTLLGSLLHTILSAAVQRYLAHQEAGALVALGVLGSPWARPGDLASGRHDRSKLPGSPASISRWAGWGGGGGALLPAGPRGGIR